LPGLKQILLLGLFIITNYIEAQNISNLRQKKVVLKADTILMDSLSLVPNSEIIFYNNNLLDEAAYEIDYPKSLLIVKDKLLIGAELSISYRVFPLSFSNSFEHKPIQAIEQQIKISKNPFKYEYTVDNEDIFYLNGLNKSGSISRGVVFGNNQDLSVNSSLDLQLSGKLSDNISILATISDDNIPIQAEGNTQQLQEFDQVFIQLFSDKWKLTAGDFYLKRPKSYFMNFNKKAQGGSFEIKLNTSKKDEFRTMTPIISAAVSRGKFARNKIAGIEGNQGPYRLKGAENETFIIILSGTEKIYIDGRLMKRGNEFDYVIDYNTAELSFTANRLITKDSRIVAEFQYSDKNYARSLIHFGNEYNSKKLKMNINIYSEQDSKDQPLQQDLNDSQKRLLANIGDSLSQAIVPNVSLVEFSENLVLYKMIDTLGFDSVFVYSTNPDSAIYQLGFSFLGTNKGNYKQIQSSANGKVYEWQVPVLGIPQGDYEPVILLIAPKKLQMATFGGQYNFTKTNYVMWEGAVSNNDINTFSDKDRNDDIGYAFKVKSSNKIKLNKAENPWNFNVGAGYEFIDQFFTPIERFRRVEFERDWNISNTLFSSDQHLINAFTGLEKKDKAGIMYTASILQNIGEFEGVKNAVSLSYKLKGFTFKGNGNYLITEGINNTQFLRHKGTLTKGIGWVVIGVGEETEQNKFFANQTDSLLANSFEFIVLRAFIHNADTTINKFMLSYKQREDNTPVSTDFTALTRAEDIELALSLLKNRNHKFRSRFTYRKLNILSSSLTTIEPEENILARLEYVSKFFKNVITSNTYYEIGSGLEIKKEFSFIQVQPGQGTHAYIGDLNTNGVKDLNEFEVAIFQDQADFIKIFTPTNEFVRTFTNSFNQGLFLRPEAQWGSKTGMKKLVSRFSNRTNYRVSRKISDKTDYLNPFIGDINDSTLVTLNFGFLNTIYFNRTGTKFGLDFTFQDNKDKSLLTNGIESRRTLTRTLKSRWNITRVFTLTMLASNGDKTNSSEFFSTRNFDLLIQEAEPKFSVQPNVKFRASILFNYKEKTNEEIFGGEKSISQKAGVELRYNIAAKGSFRASFNYIENTFTTTNNASLTYEMLEGLQEGANMTWEAGFQRNISKHMQLSINYNGRKSEDTPVIHIGGVQVRAFF
jgi:hypothetical protein